LKIKIDIKKCNNYEMCRRDKQIFHQRGDRDGKKSTRTDVHYPSPIKTAVRYYLEQLK
jgi:hypothetical protein